MANHFVSHAWSYPFGLLLGVLEQGQAEAPSGTTVYFWLDVFAINQHRVHDPDQLAQVDVPIETSQSLLMVMAPWSRPTPLTRMWCLFEVLKAVLHEEIGRAHV